MELIDTHQHAIFRDQFGYSWTNGIPELEERDFTLEDYDTLTSDAGVIGTIFMEAGVDDVDYLAK